MVSQSNPKLPIIHFPLHLEPGTPEWESLKSEVRKALEKYGCFEGMFNRIPQELNKEIISAMEEFFDLPLQTKQSYVSEKPYHGFFSENPEFPLLESMGFGNGTDLENVEAITTAFWPEGNPSFCKTIHSFSERLAEVDKMVRRMIAESLGLQKYVDEHLNSTDYILRLMKYKIPETTSEAKLGMRSHTDKSILTILFRNQVAGLEVQTKDGEWVGSTPHSFTVIVGAFLHAWVNGHLHAPLHRVMMSGNEDRFSVGLFAVPKSGYIVKAPEEVVDEDHPLLFKPFDHDGFLRYHSTEAGVTDPNALKTYCGL